MANTILISGHVGSDPTELAEGDGKDRMLSFDLAHRKFARSRPHWFRVEAYGRRAEIVADELEIQKGDLVAVEGRLRSKLVEHGCGKRHRVVTVVADRIYLQVAGKHREESLWEDRPGRSDLSYEVPGEDSEREMIRQMLFG